MEKEHSLFHSLDLQVDEYSGYSTQFDSGFRKLNLDKKRSPRILIVDDDIQILFLIKVVFESLGCKVVVDYDDLVGSI